VVPSFHQVLIAASPSDAITNFALTNRDSLRKRLGCQSEVFSLHIPPPSMEGDVHPLRKLEFGSPSDVVIYHLSIGDPRMTSWLLRLEHRLVVSYHNVTPMDRYLRTDPTMAAALQWGRVELAALASRAVFALADSEYSTTELRSAGYRAIATLPAGFNPLRLRSVPSDHGMAEMLSRRGRRKFLLFVSQIAAHKRAELAIQLVHLLRTVHGKEVDLVLAGPQRQAGYVLALRRLAIQLGVSDLVWFTGEISDGELATLYRHAACFIGTSDHEGLAVPPVEAMAEGLPVVIRGCGAVAETVGDGGIVLPCDAGVADLCESVLRVTEDPVLGNALTAAGLRRVELLRTQQGSATFVDAMRALVT
jgi:glycosyltransferase involved in cell wall biosynthesis